MAAEALPGGRAAGPPPDGARAAAGAALRLARLFWWDSPRAVRAEASARLGAVVAVQLLRGRARAWLSAEKRRQVETMLRAGGTDRRGILVGLARYSLALAALSPFGQVYWRCMRGLRQQWERHLTGHFLETFVEAQCLGYGDCQGRAGTAASDRTDRHPDQRIANDVGKFVQLCTSLSLEWLEACIHLYFFSGVLRDISPVLNCGVLVGAGLGTALTTWLGRRLVRLYDEERSADSDFVYSLTRVRENAESIAFYRGQAQEVSGMLRKLARRLQTEWRRLANKDVVQAYSTMFRQFVGLLPVYVLAGRSTPQTQPSSGHDGGAALLDGHGHAGHGHGHAHGHGAGHDHEGRPAGGTDIAAVNQAREVFDEVLYHLLIVAENTSDFSRLATVALELDRYSERSRRDLQQLQSETGAGGRLLPAPPGGPFWLQVEDLTLWAPGEPRRLLVKELSVAMTGGDRLLICGPSGAGKTTLLRAIAGLWLQWTGSIRREMDARRVMFLPQRPYIQVGTLREQLLYPFGAGSDCSHGAGGAAATDDELKQIMQRVGLQPVLLRVQGDLGARRRWAEELSVGEQQRVSIARILVHKPAFAILDEATSANDTGHELTMYRCVQETCSAFVSVGHRESIEAFHTGKLTLLGEGQQGQWTLEPL